MQIHNNYIERKILSVGSSKAHAGFVSYLSFSNQENCLRVVMRLDFILQSIKFRFCRVLAFFYVSLSCKAGERVKHEIQAAR